MAYAQLNSSYYEGVVIWGSDEIPRKQNSPDGILSPVNTVRVCG